jgi:hypothetical protein
MAWSMAWRTRFWLGACQPKNGLVALGFSHHQFTGVNLTVPWPLAAHSLSATRPVSIVRPPRVVTSSSPASNAANSALLSGMMRQMTRSSLGRPRK